VIDLVECKVGAFARAFCQYLLALASRVVYVVYLWSVPDILPGEEVESLRCCSEIYWNPRRPSSLLSRLRRVLKVRWIKPRSVKSVGGNPIAGRRREPSCVACARRECLCREAGCRDDRDRSRAPRRLKLDDFSSNRHRVLTYCWRVIFSRKPVPTFRDHAFRFALLEPGCSRG
jgi:hypothetical protein